MKYDKLVSFSIVCLHYLKVISAHVVEFESKLQSADCTNKFSIIRLYFNKFGKLECYIYIDSRCRGEAVILQQDYFSMKVFTNFLVAYKVSS